MRTCCVKLSVLLLGLSFFPIWNGAIGQNIIFVDQAAVGLEDGSSWTNAYIHLQDALQAANGDVEIWVASGTYRPDQGASATLGDREAAFYIPGGVSLYGGFSGIELMLEERDWEVNETILSGDLLGNDDELLSRDNPLRADNSYHVVRIRNTVDRVVLDGFSITDGMADERGGGRNRGAGIEVFINYDHPDPVGLVRISNCLIELNVATNGVIYLLVLPRTVEPETIIENSEVRNNRGLGVNVDAGTTLIRNVNFNNNESDGYGSILSGNEDVFVVGSTIAFNTAVAQVVHNGPDVSGIVHAGKLYMWNNLIVGNTSESAPVFVEDGPLVSVNNIFSGNHSSGLAGAIQTNNSTSRIVNNVFAFNSAGGAAGSVIKTTSSEVHISNSIFWENSGAAYVDLSRFNPDESIIVLGHSLIQNDLAPYVLDDGGNRTGDPLFVDADGLDDISGTIDDNFRLTRFSPAIDAGDPEALPIDFLDLDNDGNISEPWPSDFDGNRRAHDYGELGHSFVDMGAFEFAAQPLGASSFTDPEAVPFQIGSLEVYPNPAESWINVIWNLPLVASARLNLYDVSGRHIRTAFRGSLMFGDRIRISLTDLPPGVYFIWEAVTGEVVQFFIPI